MSSSALSSGHALRRALRIDPRVLLGILLVLVAAAGEIAFWNSTTDTRGVLVVTQDLPAGATLTAADLAVAQVHLDDALYAANFSAADEPALLGRQLGEPAHARQILARAQVVGGLHLDPGQLAMTIAVSAETAADGQLKPGDDVEVLVTVGKGQPDSRTSVVLPRVTVYGVGHDQRLVTVNQGGAMGAGQPAGPLTSLTLIVTVDQAVRLANAKWNGDLDVALLPPLAASPTPDPASSR